MTGSNTCDFWRQHGDAISPHLKRAAQSVLGAPASCAAIPERDLVLTGGHTQTPSCSQFPMSSLLVRARTSPDPKSVPEQACLEILLFLRASFDAIPKDIPRLVSQKELEEAIPSRFRDPASLEEVQALDPYFFGREDEIEGMAQKEEVFWEEEEAVLGGDGFPPTPVGVAGGSQGRSRVRGGRKAAMG